MPYEYHTPLERRRALLNKIFIRGLRAAYWLVILAVGVVSFKYVVGMSEANAWLAALVVNYIWDKTKKSLFHVEH